MVFMYHGSLRACAAQPVCTTRLVCSFLSTTLLYTNLILERRFALGCTSSSDSASQPSPSICSVLSSPKLTDPPLRINTQVSNASLTNHRTMSMEPHQREARHSRSWVSILSPSRMRATSPVTQMRCDGWCGYDVKLYANVVGIMTLRFAWWPTYNDIPCLPRQISLSACSDPQRAWEGPRGSLTTVLCDFLGQPTFLKFGLYLHTDIYRRHIPLSIIP
jgi:hypothetical protein